MGCKHVKTLAITVLWVNTVVLGCATAKIQPGRRGDSPAGKPRRLYVLVEHSAVKNLDDPSTVLCDDLSTILSQFKVESRTKRVLGLPDAANAYVGEVAAFGADGVLAVKMTGTGPAARYDKGAYYGPFTYDVTLYAPGLDKTFWHAEAQNNGGTAMMRKRLKKMARSIVMALRRDGLI
jgi:hypothetical protein